MADLSSNKISNLCVALCGALIASSLFQWIFYFLSPFSSTFNTHIALAYTVVYILISAVSCFLFLRIFTSRVKDSAKSNAWLETQGRSLFNSRTLDWLLVIVLAGLACHLIDKFVVRNIQPSWCLRTLREAWLKYPRSEDSIATSLWSAFGHIGIYFSFPAAFFFWNTDHGKNFLMPALKFGLINFALMLYSLTIGSRSVILLYLAVNLGSLVLAKIVFLKRQNYLAIVSALVVCSAFYASVVFYNRIACEENTKEYSYIEGYFSELYISPKAENSLNIDTFSEKINWVRNTTKLNSANCFDKAWACRLRTSIELVLIYLNHGIWNFETTIHQSSWPGTVLLNPIKSISSRLKISPKEATESKRTYGAGSICLVGAIWYDLKDWGILVLGILHGLLMALPGVLLAFYSRATTLCGILLFLFLFTVNALSPWVFAPNLMASPFVTFAFLCSFFPLLGWKRLFCSKSASSKVH